MSAFDALGLLAEIAVAIAGFSSVVVVFGRRAEGRWSQADRFRLSVLIGLSLPVAFFALLPSLILLLHGSEAIGWGTSSALLAICLLVWGRFLSGSRGLVASQPGMLNPRVYVLGFFLVMGAVLVQVLNLAGPFDQEPGPFVLGLSMLLLSSAIQFIRLVFMNLDPGAHSPAQQAAEADTGGHQSIR